MQSFRGTQNAIHTKTCWIVELVKQCQWCNRCGVGLAEFPPPPPWHFWPGNFCWSTGNRETRKKGKMEKKKRKIKKGREGGKLENGRRKTYQMRKGLFFFFFSKPLKFVLGVPKWEFSTRKKFFYGGKKNQEKWLCPPLKIFPLTPLNNAIDHN